MNDGARVAGRIIRLEWPNLSLRDTFLRDSAWFSSDVKNKSRTSPGWTPANPYFDINLNEISRIPRVFRYDEVIQNQFFPRYYAILSIIVFIPISKLKLYLTKTSFILKKLNYSYSYRFKIRARNFQPEKSQKFKNKQAWPKNGGFYKKKCVHANFE